MKLTALAVAALALTAIPAEPARADDPKPVITCVTLTVHVGETLHCTVTDTGGYTPADKITWTSPRTRKTYNVWNGAGQTFDIAYTPDAGEVGRNEVLSATIYIPAEGHIVRPSAGSVSFAVLG